ncbi:MAG: GNAT family N-acetyltransferase [Verrucomicrobium sp.]
MHSPNETLLPQGFPGGQLRRLRHSDLTAFRAYRAIPELGRFQVWSPMSEAEALEFLSEMNEALPFTPGEWIQLGIAEPESDQLIGDIGLFLSEDGFTGRVGFTLTPSAQGRGIATSAVRQALRIFFRATSARHVEGITDSRNAASIRLLERIGFRHHETHTAVFRGEACAEKTYLLPRYDS